MDGRARLWHELYEVAFNHFIRGGGTGTEVTSHTTNASGTSGQHALCAKLQRGRTTVKKFLRKLESLGLIAINPRWTVEGDPSAPKQESWMVRRSLYEQSAIPDCYGRSH